MRDAEAGWEAENIQERCHPQLESATAGRVRVRMKSESGIQETRPSETGWEQMGEQEKITL